MAVEAASLIKYCDVRPLLTSPSSSQSHILPQPLCPSSEALSEALPGAFPEPFSEALSEALPEAFSEAFSDALSGALSGALSKTVEGEATQSVTEVVNAMDRHIRWRSVETFEVPTPEQPRSSSSSCSVSKTCGVGKEDPALCGAFSSDSGCESEGSVEPDSVYSTVTSCHSDLVRMQLQTGEADEEEDDAGEDCSLVKQQRTPDHDRAAKTLQEVAAVLATSPLPPESSPTTLPALQLVEAAVHLPLPGSSPSQLLLADVQQLPDVQQQQNGNEEFRARCWSLDPRLHTRASDSCSAEDSGSIGAADDLQPSAGALPLRQARSEPSLSTSVSLASMPICRICHMPSEEGVELISPCRCAGTMRFIHASCLMHWIEVSGRRNKRPPICELCQFQYQRHKRFRVGRWLLPRTSTRDKVLHALFVLMLVVMVVCGVVTVFCFKQDSGKRRSSQTASELTPNELVTLVCGVLFFGAFFMAMYAQVKARHSLYELLTRFVRLNQQWYIDQYDRDKDEKFSVAAPV